MVDSYRRTDEVNQDYNLTEEIEAEASLLGQRLIPDEVAALAVFLANEEAQVLNGQSFNLCGCVCFD